MVHYWLNLTRWIIVFVSKNRFFLESMNVDLRLSQSLVKLDNEAHNPCSKFINHEGWWERNHVIGDLCTKPLSTDHVVKKEAWSQTHGTMIPSMRGTYALPTKLITQSMNTLGHAVIWLVQVVFVNKSFVHYKKQKRHHPIKHQI